jgi:hypothetical protein
MRGSFPKRPALTGQSDEDIRSRVDKHNFDIFPETRRLIAQSNRNILWIEIYTHAKLFPDLP